MEQQPIFVSVEQDLGLEFGNLVSPPYDFARHDAEVRRRIAAQQNAEPGPDLDQASAAPA
jgi:hypothetical protein